MTAAIILDVETTGIDDPDVIQLAATEPIVGPDLIGSAQSSTRHFRPRKPITLGALAAHHILEVDLMDSELWTGSWPLPEGVTYLIGHNIDFDWKAIGSPHVARICTLALSRSLWPDLDSHTLTALTYFFQGRDHVIRETLRGAHSAATDVMLCSWLLRAILERLPGTMSWHQLWVASERARIPTHIGFGKLGPRDGKPGMRCAEIRKFDPGYWRWLMNDCDQVKNDPYLRKALMGECE